MRRAGVAMVLVGVLAVGVVVVPRLGSKADLRPAASVRQIGTSKVTDGVTVRGHWLIDVTNPDGSVANHVEFDNAFTGGPTLADLFGRRMAIGTWMIELANADGFGPCGGLACLITEPGTRVAFRPLHDNMERSSTGASLRLIGTATATADGTIAWVRTRLNRCATTTAPSACTAATAGAPEITAHAVDPVVPLRARQNVLVQVTLTFA